MSAVYLKRPLLYHLHLPSHLPLAVSLYRPAPPVDTISLRTRVKLGRGAKLFWGGVTGLKSSRGGERCADFFIGGHFSLPWTCRSEVGYGKVAARRGLRKSAPVLEQVEEVMEEKPTSRKRPSLMPKQLNLRVSAAHGNTFISYVQILGTGMDTRDTSPSVLLFFDKRRIIFNAGEGLQRFCIEHKIKLSKLDHVFLTRICSETTSGLPGLLLTLSNTGDNGMAVNLWGHSDLNFLVNAMRTFIPHSSVVYTHSFGSDRQESPAGLPEEDTLILLEDDVVKISAVLLRPIFTECASDTLSRQQMLRDSQKFETNDSLPQGRYLGDSSGKILSAQSEGSSFLFAEPWELGFKNDVMSDNLGSQKRPRVEPPLVGKSQIVGEGYKEGVKALPMPEKEFLSAGEEVYEALEVAVAYICELPEVVGKFDPEKAKAKGLRPGPKYGKLQGGQSVIDDAGRNMVLPSDVMDPSSPGPICLVVDCPSMAHVSSLISSPGLGKFFSARGERAALKKVTCIIHLSPASVVNLPQYGDWMARFEGTNHVMAGHGMLGKVPHVLKSSARVMSRLNFVCPQFFPIVGLQQVEDSMDVSQDEPTSGALITAAENLLKFRLRPISTTPFDRSLVPEPLDISAVQAELIANNPELQEASKIMAELWNSKSKKSRGPVTGRTGSPRKQKTRVATKESVTPGDNIGKLSPDVEGTERLSLPGGSADLVEELPGCLKGVSREEMEIVFLGTGSSQPSKYRNVSAIYIHLFRRGGLLLDCGEGTYAQLKRRYGNAAADEIVAGIKCVWISHIHADHHTGLARILSARKQLLECQGKFEPVLVVGPKLLKRYLDAYRRLEDLGMEFLDCSQTTFDAESAARFNLSDEDFPGKGGRGNPDPLGGTDNSVENNGNLTKASAGLIRPLSPAKKLNGDGLPVRGLRNYWLQSGFNLQAGVDVQGREMLKVILYGLGLDSLISVPVVHCPHAFGVVLVARGRKLLEPGWKLAYSGDTRPCQALVEASEGATILIHEATFDDTMPEEAIAKNHSLTREAIETGISAGAYRTILTHFSQRYPKIPVFNESYNDRTCIAFDMMSVNLADLPFLPKLLPALKLLFKDDLMVVDEEVDELVEHS